MGEGKDPVVKVDAPLEDGDVIIDAFGTRFRIMKEDGLGYNRHPVDVLKELIPDLDPAAEENMRAVCDGKVTFDEYLVWKVSVYKKAWTDFVNSLDIGDGDYDSEAFNKLNELSGAIGEIEISPNEIICPFCQTPQQKTCVYRKMRLICKSCGKTFEVERKI